jgi:hypothetical protein
MRLRAAAVVPVVALVSVFAFGWFGAAGAAGAASGAVTPTAGLLDGQSVTVTGAGFDPDAQVGMAECLTGTVGTAECDLAGDRFVTTDASGSFSSAFRVTRFINVGGSLTDCATAGACVLGLEETDAPVTATVPLSFADVPIVAPTVTVNPSTDLVDQQVVQVAGSGFTAGATVALLECPAGSTAVSACDFSTILIVTADATGAIDTPYSAVRVITVGGASLDCATPAACVLSAGNVDDFDQRILAAISFASLLAPPSGVPAPVGPPAAPTPPAPIPTLAMTGSSSASLVLVGGGLLVAGLLTMLAASGFGMLRRGPFRAGRPFGHDRGQ